MIEFWYEFASTYSYPAAMRVERLAAEAGVAVVWRPFLLGPLFHAQQGLTDSPFNAFPVKGKYMWRDMERVCAEEGLPLNHPSQFPRNGLLAARVAIAGLDDGWTPDFSRKVYEANFVADQDISSPEVLAPLIAEAGGAPHEALGLQGLGWEGEQFSAGEIGALRSMLRAKANSIEGGTSEINLNVVAKRVLGLLDHQ
jgi:2-hydroxychromene-2-carboxylate isomerase